MPETLSGKQRHTKSTDLNQREFLGSWSFMGPGKCQVLTLGADNNPWWIDDQGFVCYGTTGGAKPIIKNTKMVDISAEKHIIMAVDHSGHVYQCTNENKDFEKISGSLKKVVCLGHNSAYGIDRSNQLVRLNPAKPSVWETLGKADRITQIAGNKDVLYGLDKEGNYYEFNFKKKDWEKGFGNFTSISVGANGEAYAAHYAGYVLHRSAEKAHWEIVESSRAGIESVAIGIHSRMVAIDRNKTIQRFAPSSLNQSSPVPGVPMLPFDTTYWRELLAREDEGFPPFKGREEKVYEELNKLVAITLNRQKKFDIRNEYTNSLLRGSLSEAVDLNKKSLEDSFGPTLANAVIKTISDELIAVHSVNNLFESLKDVMKSGFMDEGFVQNHVQKMLASEKNPPPVSFSFLDIVFAIFGAGLAVALGGAGEELSDTVKGAIEGTLEVIAASTMYALETGEDIEEDWRGRKPVEATEAALWNELSTNFETLIDKTLTARERVLTSKDRLSDANEWIANQCSDYGTIMEKKVPVIMATGYKIALYKTLLPVVAKIVAFPNPEYLDKNHEVSPIWKKIDKNLGGAISTRGIDTNHLFSFLLVKMKVHGVIILTKSGSLYQPLDVLSPALLTELFGDQSNSLRISPKEFFLGAAGWDGIPLQRAETTNDPDIVMIKIT